MNRSTIHTFYYRKNNTLRCVLERQLTASLRAEILLNRRWMITVNSVSTKCGFKSEDSLIKEASIGTIFNVMEQ